MTDLREPNGKFTPQELAALKRVKGCVSTTIHEAFATQKEARRAAFIKSITSKLLEQEFKPVDINYDDIFEQVEKTLHRPRIPSFISGLKTVFVEKLAYLRRKLKP